jgi:hypothetical protein
LVLHIYILRVQYSSGIVLVFWFWREIVFGVMYILSVQYSCVVVSVFWLWREIVLKMRTPFELSWKCWRHVGKMSVICRNVDELGNFCVRVPTPKFPRHKIFVSKISDTVPHTRTYIRTKIQCPPQNSDTGN